MSHAIVRTNATGRPFRGRCIKCGLEGLSIGGGLLDCPQDEIESDASALVRVLEMDIPPAGGEPEVLE